MAPEGHGGRRRALEGPRGPQMAPIAFVGLQRYPQDSGELPVVQPSALDALIQGALLCSPGIGGSQIR
eukprot:2563134-Alexandrium_andersonii.AAC.1